MKLVRIAVVFLALLALGIFIVGAVLPSSITVERHVDIKATPAEVYAHLDGMKALQAWSPWAKIDPDTQWTYSGPDRGVGSAMQWNSGDPNVGGGGQSIVAVDPNRRVDMKLDFGAQGEADAWFVLAPSPESTGLTRVTWGLRVEFGWDLVGRYVGLFMDKQIGASYEEGLMDLKKLVEG